MTANPLKEWTEAKADRPVPPKDPQERINFWIARGNALLEAEGKHHLHWVHINGSYSIKPRPVHRLAIGRVE